MSVLPERIQEHWGAVSSILTIRNESDYDRGVERLNDLLDEIGDNESHPLYELLDTLGTILHAYEEKHHRMPDCSGVEVIRYLMDEHALTLSDLPEIGSQSAVSGILSGKEELSVDHIRRLAERFHVSPAAFV